ncbi:MAG TPA: SagB/ThcOx family dehydrogenase [Candidatus Binatia bacterium]|nr:SagB/ThcOx family dehydrogenase [Candidatus Binatia bacterium]
MASDDGGAARRFHQATKHSLESLQREPHVLEWENLPSPFKIYKGLPALELPLSPAPSGVSAVDAINGLSKRVRAGERPDRGALARLLHFSLGILRRRRLGDGRWHDFRAAPCTGALYHVDAYLVTADLPDLPAGVYHFGPHDASLRRLREGDWRAVAIAATGQHAAVAAAPVSIVLASTYWRNAWKYRRRAYRHVFWDGGTAVAQLIAQAAADGWPAEVVLGFVDGEIERLCTLDPEREGVVCLVALGRCAGTPAPASAPPAIRFETTQLSPREVDYPEIRDVHRSSALETAEEVRHWRSTAPPARRAGLVGPLIELPKPDPCPDPLETVIARRGSTRRFRASPISQAALANLLLCASAPLSADYRVDADQALVELFLIVNAVEGLEAGAYRWHPQAGAVERLRGGECRREAGFLALGQELGADAAVNVYAITDLDCVLGALGSRGYRAAALDGGIAGGRLYLAAYAQRLGATGLTFFDDDVARFLGLRPERFGVMFLTAAGAPLRDPA